MTNQNKQRLVHVSGALIKRGDRFLLARRCMDDRFGGMWEFPGGKIEAGETPEVCIVRELKEELGLETRALDLLGEFEDELPDLKIFVHLILCEIVSGEPVCLECMDAGWFTIEEMAKLELAPMDIEICEWLAREPRFNQAEL